MATLSVLLVLTGVLTFLTYFIAELANYFEIRENWNTYRCHPSISPFATFYGHDVRETMSFCIGQSVQTYAPDVIKPLYNGIQGVARTVDRAFDKVEAVSDGVESLLSGFKTFVVEFANSFRLVGVRVRMSVIRIQEIFQRVYGVFLAFSYAAIAALTFGENMVCNPLVAFIADIAGVDVCCFAWDTMVRMADGSSRRIKDICLGDVLADGGRVGTTLQFDGTRTPMVRIDGVNVSGNHSLLVNCRWIRADAHSRAVPAESIERLWCLSTSTNRISIVGTREDLIFTDYEESSEPTVVASAQRAAECGLNGFAAVETVADFSLGLDPSFEVLCADGTWMRIADVPVGLLLPTGARVLGIVREECSRVCSVDGAHIAAAQLVLMEGVWQRVGLINVVLVVPVVLCHLLLDRNVDFVVRSSQQVFRVRDYSEWAPAQAVYDAALLV